MERDLLVMRALELELDPMKGHVLDVVYVDSTQQLALSTTHSYMFFTDAKTALMDVNGNLKHDKHMKAKCPLFGLHYSPVIDLIIGYQGEGSSHVFEVVDPRTKSLRFEIDKHSSKILTICEVILNKTHPLKNHYFVSTSLDKRVVMWPSAPLVSLLKANMNTVQRLLRIADTIDHELHGHDHAIFSVAYAPIAEMVFGCGFDFEVFAWDATTKDLIMKFVGHFKSMAGIQVVRVGGMEKLLSLDESGVLKLWTVSKDLGVYGEQDCSVTVQTAQPAQIKDFCLTSDDGKSIAVLTEQLCVLKIEGEVVDDLKPVYNGLGICPVAGRLFVCYRSSIQLVDILSAKHTKRIAFLDPDRVSSTDTIVSKSDDMKMNALATTQAELQQQQKQMNEHGNGTTISKKPGGIINVHDTISAVAVDARGKKVFIGTIDGRVLLFDSLTFGLLKQLTDEEEDHAFRQQGSVCSLVYVDRDELLVAGYANGAIKIFGGCLQSNSHHLMS